MRRKSLLSRILLGSASMAAAGVGAPAFAQDTSQEIVVTAQRREQAIQDVPIAVSALSESQLSDQGLAGGYELLQTIPNVNFSKGNFTGYNFQIRGVGSKVVAGGADTGVSIHLNNSPLTANRLFEADFYDITRVEVLRGPQGTLYGRNATGGVVNVITRQPTDDFEGSLSAEIASYESRRYTGVVNVPIVDDTLALRVAATSLDRDGFGHNNTLGGDIDGRDIWAARATLAFYPTDNITAWVMYEHFEEDDNRARVGKQLCQTDPGPASVNGNAIVNPVAQGWFSQGCSPSSLYSPTSLGAVNSLATLGGSFGAIIGLIPFNAYAGITQDPNLRNLDTAIDPIYRAEADVYQANLAVDITPSLTWTTTVSRSEDELFTFEDYNRLPTSLPFNPLPPLTSPTGVFCDPQVGCDNHFRTFDTSSYTSDQWAAETRLQSQFDGPFNFDIGVNYVNFNVDPIDYWVFSNTLTATMLALGAGAFVDFNNPPDGTGQNYYLNRSSYELTSTAVMGELYYDVFEDFRLTLGLRYTDDQKDVFPVAPILFGAISTPPVFVPPAVPHQQAEFQEWTGRFGFDWHFSDASMLYAFYSRGYKGGGFNPPSSVGIAGITETFDPEFVNAIEVGLKNTLFDGGMILNLTGFHYDYEAYQISRIVNRSSVNENIDATVQGFEVETAWEPFEGLRFNGTLGWLTTEIQGGSSLDVFNRTQGDAALTVIHDPITAQNCVAPTASFTPAVVGAINGNPLVLASACANAGALAGLFGIMTSAGHEVDLTGHELPNSPEWTFNFGAEYSWPLGGSWSATARADYYWQDDSYSRIYNSGADQIRGYENINLLFRVDNPDMGFAIELWGQNITDETAITDSYLTDDSSGLFRNIFLTDPEMYGLRVSQQF